MNREPIPWSPPWRWLFIMLGLWLLVTVSAFAGYRDRTQAKTTIHSTR